MAKEPAGQKAIVIREMALAPRQLAVVTASTPAVFIKEKPGRGGKKVKFIEGGYVVNQLNAAFSPIGWDFEIVEQGSSDRTTENNTEGEVWVKGKITIIDHKNGYRVSKTQFGQHPVHKNVPIGDAYKAASTDALKKCASLLGIGLDVYWGQLDSEKESNPKGKKKEQEASGPEIYEMTVKMVRAAKTTAPLMVILERVKESKKLNKTQKTELEKLIGGRVDSLDA